MRQYITANPLETIKLAKQEANKLKSGHVLALVGELGVGKTHFVKGLALGLGIKQNINSPTFVILKKYQLPKTKGQIKYLIHIDCYRLNTGEELLDLGWQELIAQPANLVVVEWADKIKSILPPKTRWIKFKSLNENKRQIKFSI